MKRILICCGMGMSSGFLAVRLRKEIMKQGFNYQVKACSVSEIKGYLGMTDLLLLTPPFANRLEHYKKLTKNSTVKVDTIPEDIYGTLNAKELLKSINLIFSE